MCIKGRALPWAVEFADFQPALFEFWHILCLTVITKLSHGFLERCTTDRSE